MGVKVLGFPFMFWINRQLSEREEKKGQTVQAEERELGGKESGTREQGQKNQERVNSGVVVVARVRAQIRNHQNLHSQSRETRGSVRHLLQSSRPDSGVGE